MTKFSEATPEEIRKMITKSASKSFELDGMTTWLLKECLDTLLQVITKLVNLSLSTRTMPKNLKSAILQPLIKKALLNADIFKSYRPVINLTFLFKVIKKVVAVRMKEHIYTHCLHDSLQSANLELHSTEPALIKVQNDTLCALDNGNCVILIMLDLSAAFDTVDHKILLSRLSSKFGICGKALSWLEIV